MLRPLAIIALMMIVIHLITSMSSCNITAAPEPLPSYPLTPGAQMQASGDQLPSGTQRASALYDENTSGVLPMNHSNFDAPAEFNSDVTNLNHFYRSNPEVFHGKGRVNVPNPSDWDAQARAMFGAMDNGPQGPINPYNFAQEGAPLI